MAERGAKHGMSPWDHVLVNTMAALVTIGFPGRDNEAMLFDILGDAIHRASAEAVHVRRVLKAAEALHLQQHRRGTGEFSRALSEATCALHQFSMWRLGEAQELIRRQADRAGAP